MLVGVVSLGSAVPAAPQIFVRQQAPTDRAADFPAQVLANEITRMETEGISTVWLLEGGARSTLNDPSVMCV